MRLADRIAQCRTPFVVQNTRDGSQRPLHGAAAFAQDIHRCATKYVLSDALTSLCTALAYSRGANTLACADLLHVPAERVWVEWSEAPWRAELARYGFKNPVESHFSGRRGVFVQATRQGRRGLLRTFWAGGEADVTVLSSSMEAYFDFDTRDDEDPQVFDRPERPGIRVWDEVAGGADVLRRCFRFRFEQSWQDYYDSARLTPLQVTAVSRHALGTIAIDLPVLLAFFLLLATRPGLPRRPLMLERLNRARARAGKTALLEQIEVCVPVLPQYKTDGGCPSGASGRLRRLHHVRGHLVRRGSKLFWRVPHLRGSARAGSLLPRTVTWLLPDDPRTSAAQA